MEKSYRVASWLLVLLGAVHALLTPFFYQVVNADSLWFFGTGLAYIFMGLYNLASLKVKIKSIFNVAILLNFIATLFTIAITYILREPQSYIAMAIVIFVFLNSVFIKISN
ncbi:MAG: hypothetical protein V2I54_00735 [Bacteroidales bacterium]|jgi:hypothetical protein|nr:hypothetical protein [Bacteroidales bacterium]